MTPLLERMDRVWLRIARFYEARPAAFVAVLVGVGCLVRLVAAPFGAPLGIDPFSYLLKAIEIAHGNITPVRSHAIGWPFALAPLVAIAPHASFMTLMNLTRVAAIALSALLVVPLAFIARETLNRPAQPLALVLCPFALLLVRISVRGFSEPLLTLLLLGAVAASLAAERRPAAAFMSGGLSGAAVWVHPTGVLNAAIAMSIVVVIGRGRRRVGAAVSIAVTAIVVALPALVQRQHAFGAPLDYGFNSPDILQRVEPVRARIFGAAPSASQTTRTVVEGVDRLMVRGVAAAASDFALDVVHLPTALLAVYGCSLASRNRRLRSVLVALAIFLAGWVPLYPAFGNGRHLSPALPFALALTACAIVELGRRTRHAGALTLAAALAFAIGESVAAGVQRERLLRDPQLDGIAWGRWVADNVRGRLAMIDGQELVMMHIPDAAIGGADINTMYSPSRGLSLIRPYDFVALDDALAWMRSRGVTDIVLDDLDEKAPFLAPLTRGPLPPFLVERYSTRGQSGWPVRVCGFRWDLYKASAGAR